MLFPRASPESPPMFKSRALDSVSRTHFLIVAYVYVPIVIGLVAYGISRHNVGLWEGVGLFLGGVVVWTLMEYWLHRLVFHWEPKTSWGPKMHFMMHGVHHKWPKDRFRLVMPPSASLPLFLLFGLSFWLFLGPKVWIFHGGFALGYMTYDLMHYYLHHGKLKAPWLRKLQTHHARHHFNKAYEGKNFGVSSPVWDWVFRTAMK